MLAFLAMLRTVHFESMKVRFRCETAHHGTALAFGYGQAPLDRTHDNGALLVQARRTKARLALLDNPLRLKNGTLSHSVFQSCKVLVMWFDFNQRDQHHVVTDRFKYAVLGMGAFSGIDLVREQPTQVACCEPCPGGSHCFADDGAFAVRSSISCWCINSDAHVLVSCCRRGRIWHASCPVSERHALSRRNVHI